MSTEKEIILDTLDYEDDQAIEKIKIKPFYLYINVGKIYTFGIDISKDNKPKLRNIGKGAYWCIDKIDCIVIPGRSEEQGNERLAIQQGLIGEIFPILQKFYLRKKQYIILKIKRPSDRKYIVEVVDDE